MSETRQQTNLFFRLTVLVATVFIITVLALVAATFSPTREAPAVRLLDAYGGRLVVGEVIALIVLSVLALARDRMETLRAPARQARQASDRPSAGPRDDAKGDGP